MKIAYLVFAYKNPKLIQRTMERLACEDSAFFIHIDAKCDISQFASLQGKNVFFTDRRVTVYWAEFSGVEAILVLIRQALAARERYDYLVLLSGSEYPLRSRQYIHNFFDANRGSEFMTMAKMPAAGKPLSRVTLLRFPSNEPARRLIFRALAKLGLAQRNYRKHLGGMKPYSGLTWWALTRNACQYIMDFDERERKVRRFFEKSFAPEESYFHTILGNSPFAPRIRQNLLYEDWSAQVAHPKMLGEQHLARFGLQDKGSLPGRDEPGELLFARKFSDENLGLVREIDEMIERNERMVASPC